jgi:hypothetical protein
MKPFAAGPRSSVGNSPKGTAAARRGDKWHLDEVVITIAGKKHWLWRIVDQDGFVLDILVQSRRDESPRSGLCGSCSGSPRGRLT